MTNHATKYLDTRNHRLAEVDFLVSDPAKARTQLGWQPEVSFEQLVTMMVDADMDLIKRERS